MDKETELYAPIKEMLESKGYEVKSEINSCDVVAHKKGSAVVIVELKLGFSLDLVLQGIERKSLSDDVYLAIPKGDTAAKRKNWRRRQRACLKLCRMLGVGLALVDLDAKAKSKVEVLNDPAVYSPRKSKRKGAKLIKEFNIREGDPNLGGVTRSKIVTSYRQDALRCALILSNHKKLKLSEIKEEAGVERAATILQKNHYGWFERVERGIYRLTEAGQDGLKSHETVLPTLH